LPPQQLKPNSDESNLEALCKRSLELYVSVDINVSPQEEAVNALVQAVTAVVQMLVLRQPVAMPKQGTARHKTTTPSVITDVPPCLSSSLSVFDSLLPSTKSSSAWHGGWPV
jgi:hypothetical protein